MTTERNRDEVDRIIGTVERAFGRARRQPPLQLGRDERLGRSRRGAVPAVVAGLLATGVGAFLVATRAGGNHQTRLSDAGAVAISTVPAVRPAPAPAPSSTAADISPASPARHRSPPRKAASPRAVRPRQAPRLAEQRPARSSATRPIALPDEVLERAIAEDKVLTRDLNNAVLRQERAAR